MYLVHLIQRRLLIIFLALPFLIMNQHCQADSADTILETTKELLKSRVAFHLNVRKLLEDITIPIEERYLQFLNMFGTSAPYEDLLKKDRRNAIDEAEIKIWNVLLTESQVVQSYLEVIHQRKSPLIDEFQSELNSLLSGNSQKDRSQTEKEIVPVPKCLQSRLELFETGAQSVVALRRMYLDISTLIEINKMIHAGYEMMKDSFSKGDTDCITGVPDGFSELPFLEQVLELITSYPNVTANNWLNHFQFNPEELTYNFEPNDEKNILIQREGPLEQFDTDAFKTAYVTAKEYTTLKTAILDLQNKFIEKMSHRMSDTGSTRTYEATRSWLTGPLYTLLPSITLIADIIDDRVVEVFRDVGVRVTNDLTRTEKQKQKRLKKKKEKKKKKKKKQQKQKDAHTATLSDTNQTQSEGEELDSEDSSLEEGASGSFIQATSGTSAELPSALEKLEITEVPPAEKEKQDSEIETAMKDASELFDIFRKKKRIKQISSESSESELLAPVSALSHEEARLIRLQERFKGSHYQKLLEDLFDKSRENITLDNLKTLVNRAEGKIQFSGKGGSHFTLELPGAIAFPWAPHSGNTHFSHYSIELVRKAFEKAGITPEALGF